MSLSFYIILSGSASVYVSSKPKTFQSTRITVETGPLVDRDEIQAPVDDIDAQNNKLNRDSGGDDDRGPDSSIVRRTEGVAAKEKAGSNAKDAPIEGVSSGSRSSLGKFSAKLGQNKILIVVQFNAFSFIVVVAIMIIMITI